MERVCPVCGEDVFTAEFGGERIPGYSLSGATSELYILERCIGCGMVIGTAVDDSSVDFDYGDYGEYLTIGEREVQRITGRTQTLNRAHFKLVRMTVGKRARIVDFGAGNGIFVAVARASGFDAYGVEPSVMLRKWCREHLGIELFASIDDILAPIHVVRMEQVIEHLPPDVSPKIMRDVVSRLSPGGLLIGSTPNYESVNVALLGARDPAIAPPAHACYFTLHTIDRYLSSTIGLEKVFLNTYGARFTSFMRKEKFTASFLDSVPASYATKYMVWYPLKVLEKMAGVALRVTKKGYQLQFAYRKPCPRAIPPSPK